MSEIGIDGIPVAVKIPIEAVVAGSKARPAETSSVPISAMGGLSKNIPSILLAALLLATTLLNPVITVSVVKHGQTGSGSAQGF